MAFRAPHSNMVHPWQLPYILPTGTPSPRFEVNKCMVMSFRCLNAPTLPPCANECAARPTVFTWVKRGTCRLELSTTLVLKWVIVEHINLEMSVTHDKQNGKHTQRIYRHVRNSTQRCRAEWWTVHQIPQDVGLNNGDRGLYLGNIGENNGDVGEYLRLTGEYPNVKFSVGDVGEWVGNVSALPRS